MKFAILLAVGAFLFAALTSGCQSGKSFAPEDVHLVNRATEVGIGTYHWTIPGPRPMTLKQSIGNGCAFLDYDSDGALDILLVGQPCALYKGDGKGRFTDVSREIGIKALKGDFLGVASGDYDNDGRVDVLIVDSEGAPALLHNESGGDGGQQLETRKEGNFLDARLVGGKSNRDGYGAVLLATISDGRTLRRECTAGGSYLSASSPLVHFGLGAADKVTALTILWPSGVRQTVEAGAVNRRITVREAL